MANTLYPQLQSFTLYSSGATVGDTSLVITSMKDIDGVQLTMANFGDKGFLTIDPGAGTSEEQASFTGLVANANGTTTLTGVKNVLCLSPYTETSGIAKAHSGGSTAVVAVTSGLLNQFANKGNTETVTGTYTFTTANRPLLSVDTDTGTNEALVTFGQLSRTSFSGTVDASTTVKGIVEIATGAELAAGTGTGGTGAVIVAAGSSFTNTSAGAGDVNKVAVLDAAGQFAVGFIKDASMTVTGKVELATAAETAAGTATGGTGSALVPANSTFVQSSSGSADANKVPVLGPAGSLADGFGYFTAIAGETVTAGQGAYAKASDSRAWKTAGTANESTFNFIGVFADSGTAGGTVRIVPPGGSFTTTGLTAGSYYFITDTAGTLGTTPGTRFARVGLALSTTQLLVTVPKYKASGTQSVTSATTFAQTTGFYPAKVSVRSASATGNIAGGSVGDDTNTCVAFRMKGANNDAVSFANAWYVYDINATSLRNAGNVTTKTSTGFTLDCTTYASTVDVQWTAESL